jgi:hypothetical protein
MTRINCSTHNIIMALWCPYFVLTAPMDVSHTTSPVFLNPRNLCAASAVSGFALVLVYESHFASCCGLAPPSCPRQCFQPSGTCTKSWLCVICPVCAHRWHPQIIARTARCSFLPAQPRWTRSTHLTLCSRPLGICVCALFAMVLQLNHQFCTQLARTTADQTTITSLHTDSGVPGCPLLDFIIPVLCTL